ncbi:fibronectin/fibrinogen-binding protein [Candidatus Woesearchaeota archaeon]|nr:fibronectin/fibrinogen-binding protein [Candidatus Woesearchaeota archaeon]
MKLSSLDLHNLIEEFDNLKFAKVSKVFQPKKKELLFQLHMKADKKILRINAPDYLFLTDFKEDQPEKPSNFCMIIRKYFTNSFIKKIEQKGFERVVEIVFQTKQEDFILIVELFSKGNIILCKKDYEILLPLEKQMWGNRKITKGEIYKFPEKKYNFLELTKKEMKDLVDDSDKENIVKILAIELGLGGEYAEQLCSMAAVDKNKKKLDEKELSSLFNAAVKLRKTKIKGVNKKFDDYFSGEIKTSQVAKKTDASTKKFDATRRVIETQETQIKKLKESIEEETKKGEYIYENYTKINSLLEKVKELRKKYSWKEVKDKIKEIQEVNEKEGKIIVKL